MTLRSVLGTALVSGLLGLSGTLGPAAVAEESRSAPSVPGSRPPDGIIVTPARPLARPLTPAPREQQAPAADPDAEERDGGHVPGGCRHNGRKLDLIV